ncbi:unnamed protein product [marine sediment metagenome]|uniref:Uncharacterized protein n=1 Tax=marine sediment metagenome TaxID=412755 RepID=X0UAZ9_9ZZZZ
MRISRAACGHTYDMPVGYGAKCGKLGAFDDGEKNRLTLTT